MTATDDDGGAVAVTNNTFTMPAKDVTVVSFAPDPMHFSDDGDDAYTIKTATGWDVFCDRLDAGETFSGKTVRMGADIGTTEEPVIRMAGDADHDFRGTFDGQGHTLTVRYGTDENPVAEDNVAPLRVVGRGCTITGLHVAGDIYTSAKYAGGIAGTQNGAVTISDCHVSITIHSRTSGDGSHGGLVGMNGDSDGSALTIEGCLFDGKLLTEGSTPTINCAGFVGAKGSSGTVAVTNSLYAPAKLGTGETEPSDGCATFVRNGSAGTNCYYTRVLGEAQGKEARTVSGGADVTIAPSGTATAYGVSSITVYSLTPSPLPPSGGASGGLEGSFNQGLKRGDAFYAGKNDKVSLSLSYGADVPEGYSVGYVPSAGTLSGTENPYKLAMPDEDVTISAVFGHKVTVSSEISYGSVTSNKFVAVPDDIVTLTVNPDDDNTYGLGGLLATYGDGQKLELTQGTGEDADKWTFQMPDADVVVSAEFIKHLDEEGYTYTINTLVGWNKFCDLLADNAKGIFDGKTVKLGADIEVTRMAGGSDHDFTGTFDGQGHTLTVSYGSAESPIAENKAAPFVNVQSGCTIKDLHVTGDIYTSAKFAGGLVGEQYGEVTIENCRISTTIHSYTNGDGTHGGLVGIIGNSTNAKLTIKGCLFDGKLLTEGETATTSCAGFVGYKRANGSVTITDCLYAPAALDDGEVEPTNTSATFVRNSSAGANCYYTRLLGTAQGTASFIYNSLPDGIGTKGTTYNVSGITAYENGLAYGGNYYMAPPATLSLTANLADGNYWTTFYCSISDYEIGDQVNACAYTATYDATAAQLTLAKLGTDGKQIPAATAVIIVADDNTSTVTLTATTGLTFNGSNDLRGVDHDTELSDLGSGTFYVLGNKNSHFGFHRYVGAEMAARKAYLLIPGSSNARSLDMVFANEETGIETTNFTNFTNSDDAWYDMLGRRLSGKPTKPGLYIYKAKKVAIK